MAQKCHIEGCRKEIPAALAAECLCLDHFVELAIQRADQVRARCLEAEPVDEATLDWLLDDAPNTIHALSDGAFDRDPTDNEKVLELLLCLANLQDYVAHHSLRVRRLN